MTIIEHSKSMIGNSWSEEDHAKLERHVRGIEELANRLKAHSERSDAARNMDMCECGHERYWHGNSGRCWHNDGRDGCMTFRLSQARAWVTQEEIDAIVDRRVKRCKLPESHT